MHNLTEENCSHNLANMSSKNDMKKGLRSMLKSLKALLPSYHKASAAKRLEMTDLIALFGAINISGTGRIDKDEFADLFYHLDLDISEEYLIKLFNAADRDGSGAIEFGDFLKTFHESKKEQGIYETRLKETFEMMDLDGDGYLSRTEIKDCIQTTCKDTPEETVFSLIEDADTNEDGHVSYTEFLEMWRTYGKRVTKDRADSLYEVITSQAADGRIKQKAQPSHVNEETITTEL